MDGDEGDCAGTRARATAPLTPRALSVPEAPASLQVSRGMSSAVFPSILSSAAAPLSSRRAGAAPAFREREEDALLTLICHHSQSSTPARTYR